MQVHRVKIPTDKVKQKSRRYSIVYFVDPDADYIVESLDKSDTYPPVLAGDYIRQQLNPLYE